MDSISVQLKSGEVVLRAPTAGERNRALIKAETPEGIKGMVFAIELIPMLVKVHPWGTLPVSEALDRLTPAEYDKIVEVAKPLLGFDGDAAKKSEKPSESLEAKKVSS